ncbi:MAG: SEC-C domain-containing protein [Acidobacteria bacterium]|nr:SEC-C domain-containing protein [Acidobacteriota bacterium]
MPGRNEPCPCGSGRKYKHCCLKAQEQADFLWRQMRAAEGRLVPELLQLSLKECGPALVGAALDEFFLWDGVPEDYDQTNEFSQFFVPWFVYEFVDDPDDPDRVANAPDESLASLYLGRYRERLSATECAFLEAAAISQLSFYAVMRAVPGHEIALRDVLTGAEVVVKERSASGMVKAGALLFTRVVSVQGTSIMSGCAPLVIPPEWHLPILDFRKRFAHGKGRMLTPDMVREIDIELRELYFYIEDQVWNPPLPELRNTDGERLVLTTLTYRLRCSPSAAFDRLKSLARASKGEVTQLLSEAELDETGKLLAVMIPWSKRGNRLHQEWDNTTLGTLEIDGDRLQVHVNSNARARRIEREVAKRLGTDAVLESRTADPVEKLLAERKDVPRDRIADREQEELQQRPEVQEFLRQQGERHWESWLDTRLPALRDQTPRQAAATPEGRERLEALFAEFAWMGERQQNPMSPDVAALRAKLGLS